jgi:hypothetical protein
MNWRTSIAASAAASWLAATVVGAAEPAQQQAEAKPAAESTDKGTDKTANKDNKKKDQKCAVTTGSRIRRDPPADCERATPGERSYTAEELATTGEMNLSEALRKLDPRFQ